MTPTDNKLPAIGDLVAGRYRLTRELGRGGYGVVFQAHQEMLNRAVAIKFLLPDVATDPTEVERFRREVFHASSLENRHTITLYDYGKSPAGLFFVVMEYLEGICLHDRIGAQGPLSTHQTYLVLRQVLESLDEAHQRQLVHRDLKPANIFLLDGANDHGAGVNFEVRVLDFGLSKFIGDPRSTLYRGPSLTADGEVCGTPQYMSPEHAYGETVYPAGDIYALGLVVYECLTGTAAFDDPSPLEVLLMQVNAPVPPLPKGCRDTPLQQFIERATQKDANQRFVDAGQALRWLYQHPLPPKTDGATNNRRPTFFQAITTGAKPAPTEELPPQDRRPPNLARERFELRVAQAPLVGRQRSLSHLNAWLEQAAATGGVVAITGGAGTGKSALLRSWYNQLKTRSGLQILRGSQQKTDPTLAGLRQAFADLLSQGRRHRGPISEAIAGRLRHLLDATALTDDRDQSTSTIVQGLIDLLDHLSYRQPVLLIFDDLHLADPITRRFFDHLGDSLTETRRPLAVVVTSRSTRPFDHWTRRENTSLSHWPLPPLSAHQMNQLLGHLIPTTDALAEGLITLAGPKPALLLHICRYLLETKLIVYDHSRSRWAMGDPSMAIEELVPLDLQQLIFKRADRYLRQSGDEADLRALLHRAVLLGDEFETSLLKAVLHGEGRPQLADRCGSLLAHLAASGLLRDRSSRSGTHYAFAQPLHRASLVRLVESLDDWREFHLLVAHAMIDGHRPPQWLEAGRIAHHLERGGAPQRALPWWLRAARQAESEQHLQGALRMINRALRRPPGHPVQDRLMAQMRLQQGRLCRHLGELGPAEDALDEARRLARLADHSELHAQAGELLAEVTLLQGRLEEALELLDEIDGLYQVLDDPQGRRRVRLSRADVAIFYGHYGQAMDYYQTIPTSPGRGADTPASLRALLGMARCHYAGGRLSLARSTAEKARHQAQAAGNQPCHAAALIEAAYTALLTEGLEASEALAHQALSLARRGQDPLIEANAHLALGICLRRSTNLDRARFHSRRARELHESLGHLYGIIKDILLSAEIAWVQGEPERALILAEDTARLHEELGDRHGGALSALYRSLFLIELDRPQQARKLLQQVLSTRGQDQLGLYEPQSLFYLGLAHQTEGHIGQARNYLAQAQQIARRMGHREMVSLTTINLANLQLLIGDLPSARRQIPRALEEAEDLGHGYANISALLGAALLAHLDGQALPGHDHLTRLRTYLVSPHAPRIGVATRLQRMAQLLEQVPNPSHRQAMGQALTDLQRSLHSSP